MYELLNYKEAISSLDAIKWTSTIEEEINFLHKNETWTLFVILGLLISSNLRVI